MRLEMKLKMNLRMVIGSWKNWSLYRRAWCNKWGLTINSRKTQAIVFLPPRRRSRIRRNPSRLNLTVQHQPIRPTKQVTYLGITFDHQLTWCPHLQTVITKATNRLNLLKRLTGTTWGLNSKTIINTYKAFLRPVLTYGFTSWIAASPIIYKKLQILERHALRIAFRVKLPSPTQELYDRISFPHLLFHLETLRQRYIAKRLEHQHPLLQDIIHSHTNTATPPRHIATPLSLLFAIYHYTIPPDHPESDLLRDLSAPIIHHHYAPTYVAL